MKRLKVLGVVLASILLVSISALTIMGAATTGHFLPSYTTAGLPAAASDARVARVTDNVRGIWMDQGTQWFALNGGTVNVKEFGAKGDGTTDDTTAIRNAIAANPAVVSFPPGSYVVTSSIVIPRGITLRGEGKPAGGTGATATNFPQVLHNFSGHLFVFDGSSNDNVQSSGGGVERLRLTQNFGTLTANGAGTAIRVVAGTSLQRPSWLVFRLLLIEQAGAVDSWSWGFDFDGSAIVGGAVPDVYISESSTHTTATAGGALRTTSTLSMHVVNCQFYDTQANVTITGVAGNPSKSIALTSVDISGLLTLDFATDTTILGGILNNITATANVAGSVTILPARMAGTLTDSSPSNVGMFSFSSVAIGNALGSFRFSKPLLGMNSQYLQFLNFLATTTIRALGVDVNNAIRLGPDADAIIALGSVPTFGAALAGDTLVAGALLTGTAGSRITLTKTYAPTLTPAATGAAIGTVEQTFTVTGLTTADKVFVNGPVPTALCPAVTFRVSAADTLAIGFADMTALACTPAAGVYNIVAIRS